jgi:hypothetical protein
MLLVPDIATTFPLPNSKLPITGQDIAEQVASWLIFAFDVITNLFTDSAALVADPGGLAHYLSCWRT